MTKKLDLEELKRLYAEPGRGHTDIELAGRFEVDRTAIYKARQKLVDEGVQFKETERGRYRADSKSFISNIAVSQSEALVLYLATRRLSRNTRLAKQPVQNALGKLALALYKPMTEKLVQAAAKAPAHPDEAKRVGLLDELIRGWSEQSAIRIKYRSLTRQESIWHEVSPYLIEPSPWSDSVYLIGYSAATETIIPFSIERIEKAMLTSAPFKACAPEMEERLLQYAWGIWGSEGQPEQVKLRFTGPEAIRRLQESQWHPDQTISQPDEHGHIIWQAPIAEWREMLPWVRGWGADCEVVGPEGLREVLEREVKRLTKVYGLKTQPQQDDPLLRFDHPARLLWAKTNRHYDQDYDIHPLVCHLIDVAQMVCALWDQHLPQATRRYFSQALNLPPADARRWLAFLAGLHDLGKACPVFQVACQKEYPQVVQQLKAAGFPFEQADWTAHGIVSAWSLKELFQQELGLDRETAHILAVAIGGHHGTIITSGNLKELGPRQRGSGSWDTARLTLCRTLAQTLELNDLGQFHPPSDPMTLNTFTIALAGFISFSDWLGSMSDYFRFAEPDVTLAGYAELAYNQAKDALQKLGWLGWSPPQTNLSFEQLFPFPPRPLQQAIATLVGNRQVAPPALVIVEAPTGEGKTEAAWYLADRWLAEHQQRGVYVAMPTQATSNQMLGRVKIFLEKRYPEQETNLLLLHGDALFSAEMEQLKLAAIGDSSDETVVAHAWFLPKKRSLLAPFAVGTVDQSLLAVLQTKHFFVRLFGLSHKTVIFDEVHAYDTYMNTLLRRLLAWLRQMGASVILLSATLPAKTRQVLVEAYTGQPFEQPVEYPAITWATAQSCEVSKTSQLFSGVIPLEASQARTINLDWIKPDTLLETIRAAVETGGCVAVLCNTVNQAQAIYRLLEAEKLAPDDDLILFHARFPFYLRQKIEEAVLEKFGKPDETKPNRRPQKAIVVATQVIEQSLDLDFDLLISYLAPVDLLLQRAGRLHRHYRPLRPTGLETPRLLLVQPELENDIPQLGVDKLVYAPYILLRSYLALHNKPELRIPADVQPLIEAVYGDVPLPGLSPAWETALKEAKIRLDKEVIEQENAAEGNLIFPPEHKRLFKKQSKELEEDKPDLHETLQALTRLTRPSVTLICLHRTSRGIAMDIDGTELVDLENEPDFKTAQKLAAQKVNISNWEVVKHFSKLDPPKSWCKHPLLRSYRIAEFEGGICHIGDSVSLLFDLKQGLVIQKEAK